MKREGNSVTLIPSDHASEGRHYIVVATLIQSSMRGLLLLYAIAVGNPLIVFNTEALSYLTSSSIFFP